MILLNIADIRICIDSDIDIDILDSYVPFIDCNETVKEPFYLFEIRKVDGLGEIKEPPIYSGYSFYEYVGNRRQYFDGNSGKVYADAVYDLENRKITLRYTEDGYQFLNESGNTFFHIAWEKVLMNEGRILLHGAFVSSGILFMGPSGIGKSTQAKLWEEYEGVSLLNGDRTIVDMGTMKGYGSPHAGSSKCYINEAASLKAVVSLKKSSDNRIRRLHGIEGFTEVFKNMTVNTWDRAFVDRACRAASRLLDEIPVYELSCTPDERAVILLKGELGCME